MRIFFLSFLAARAFGTWDRNACVPAAVGGIIRIEAEKVLWETALSVIFGGKFCYGKPEGNN